MTPRPLPLVSIFLLCLAPGFLHAQEPTAPEPHPAQVNPEGDPYNPDRLLGIPAARAPLKVLQLRLRLEIWEATALDALRWQDEATGKDSIAKLREELAAGKRPGRLVFNPTLLLEEHVTRKAESTAEWIYPTEYIPPGLPADLPKTEPGKPPEKNFLQRWHAAAASGKFAYPSSFETRNTGQTLEAGLQAVTAEPGSWDISLNFDDVSKIGNLAYGQAEAHVEMPLFASFRAYTVVRLKEGQWRLYSVMEPPRGLDGKPTDKRWLTFLRIDPQS